MAGSVALSVDTDTLAVTLAERLDDAELRRLLRAAAIPGQVRVALTREPDFFAADGLAGGDDVTLVVRHDGRLVGMGRLSVYPLMRNGAKGNVGYLGALRVASGTRESPRLLRDGYRILEACAPPFDCCLTSIASDNTRARRVLEHGGRFGLPTYRPLRELVTLVAPVRPPGRAARPESAGEDELRGFLGAEAERAHLALTWDDRVWAGLRRHGVTARDFVVVRHAGEIVGAGAVWDQRSFRQNVIDGYDGLLGAFRPVLNGLRAVAGWPLLPAPGDVLSSAALLGACVRDADRWLELWRVLCCRAASMGLDWLTMTRDAQDPELPILRRLTRARVYRTTLYEVALRGDSPDRWDARCVRPEVGLL